MLVDILAVNTWLTKSEETSQKEMKRLSKQVKLKLETNTLSATTQNLQYAIKKNMTATIGMWADAIVNMVNNKMEEIIVTKLKEKSVEFDIKLSVLTTLIQPTKSASTSSTSKSPLTKLSSRDDYST